jgi:hypothetical protein
MENAQPRSVGKRPKHQINAITGQRLIHIRLSRYMTQACHVREDCEKFKSSEQSTIIGANQSEKR